MAKKTFKGRPLIPGNAEGKALASKQPLNTTGSYLENLFGGNTESAPCTDAVNESFHGKNLAGQILCFPTTVGSTMGGATLMGVGSLGLGPKAMLERYERRPLESIGTSPVSGSISGHWPTG